MNTFFETALGNVNTFGELVSLLWAYGSQVIIGLAVFFIILGAFVYVTSAGNEDKITQGKEMVLGSLTSIVIVMLSGVLIRILHQPAAGTTGSLSEIPTVIQNASNILVGIIGTFAILMMIYSGILYMMAGGEPDKISKARRSFIYAVSGLALGVLAYAIASAVINFLA